MGITMTVSEARASLPAVVGRVLAGEEVTLTRHGQPVAVIVRPDTLRSRRADAALAAANTVHEVLERARAVELRPSAGLGAERGEQLLAKVRADRAKH